MALVRPWMTLAIPGTSWVGGRLNARWPEQLSHDLPNAPEVKGPVRVYNFGQGGFTSSQILAQKIPLICDLRPTHVFYDTGAVNSAADGGGGPAVTRAQHILDIQAAVTQMRAAIPGVDITLMTMYSLSATSALIHPAYPDYVADILAQAALLNLDVLDNYAGMPKPMDPALTYGAGAFAIAPTATYDPMPDGAAWNAADKSANVALSVSDTQALAATAAVGGVRGNMALTGKMHFEVAVDLKSGNFPYIGLANSTAALGAFIGTDVHGLALRADGTVWRNNASLGASGLVPATGDVIGVEVDRSANLAYFMKGAFRSAGFDISGVAGTIYPAMTVNTSVTGGTARFTPNGDGLHPVWTGLVDTYHYPQTLTKARAKAAAFWPG